MPKEKAIIHRETNPGPLENPALEFLRTYWLEKRGDRAMPSRADMVPADLKKYLDAMTMVDVLEGGDEFRFRLVGTAVTRYFLADPTGMRVADAWAAVGPMAVERMCNNLRAIVRERACVHLSGTVDWYGNGIEEFEALYAPLSEDGENVNMIVNLFSFDRRRILLDRQIEVEKGRRSLTA